MINRRRFLHATAGLSLLGASKNAFAHEHGKAKIGVALVGLGNYSETILAPALTMTEHCELRGIVTGSPSKVSKWQQKYSIKDSNVYDYDNLHEIANNDDIDVVYVVVPTSLHKKFTLIAANAGKHVWCEKPMAMNQADCQAMITACEKNKVQLTIGYRLQHEPNTQTLMSYADSKPYGELKAVSAFAGYKGGAPAKDDWRLNKSMGGGAAYDMGVYSLNAARYSTGLEPIAVTAEHKVYRPEVFTDVDEATFFQLEFANGLIADCGTSVYENMNSLRVDCDNGWYKLEPFQTYHGVQGETSDGVLLNQTIDNQQARQMDNDALAIIQNSAPLVSGYEGMNDIKVVEAILRSAAHEGKRIVI